MEMVQATLQPPLSTGGLPDHTQLPDEDPSLVHNTHEHPQSNLLTECLLPQLADLHPDRNYFVAADVGIYFEYTEPVLDGCRVPDWFYVPGVPPMLDGELRRSYVLWKELIRPAIVIEYISGDGSEEHDRTPRKGKFWIYERVIAAGYYIIFDPKKRSLEVFCLNGNGYHEVPTTEAGRYLIKGLNVEVGIWDGTYRDITLSWLRVWDPNTGKLLPLAEERAEIAEMALEETRSIVVEHATELEARGKRIEAERRRADKEKQLAKEQKKLAKEQKKRADEQQQRADEQEKMMALLLAKLREAGIDPTS